MPPIHAKDRSKLCCTFLPIKRLNHAIKVETPPNKRMVKIVLIPDIPRVIPIGKLSMLTENARRMIAGRVNFFGGADRTCSANVWNIIWAPSPNSNRPLSSSVKCVTQLVNKAPMIRPNRGIVIWKIPIQRPIEAILRSLNGCKPMPKQTERHRKRWQKQGWVVQWQNLAWKSSLMDGLVQSMLYRTKK